MVGLVMRLYRASPLHPRLGAGLARLLGLVTRHLPSPQLRLVDGIRWELDLSEVIDASLFFSGSFEPRAERTLAQHLAPGMTAIDVGANIGYHALRMARCVGPQGRVVALEPSARAVGRLRRNLELNAFGNVEVVVAALGDHDSELEELQLQSSYPLSGPGEKERTRVRVARLDTLVSELALERVDLVKIDVDGHEARVLRGALGTLERFRPTVFFELTPSAVEANGDSVEALLASLSALGYVVADEDGRPLQDPLRAVRGLPRGAGCNLLARPASRAAVDEREDDTMSERAGTGAERELPWVATFAALVGLSAISLSLTGLVGRLTVASVSACLLLALVGSAVLARRQATLGLPRLIWLTAPFLAPSMLAALLLPPHSWDDVAYGAALPRDYAKAGHLYYNADYGPYSAFPANYEALVTASLVLTGDVRLTQMMNVLLAALVAVSAVLLARALGAERAGSWLAGVFVLASPALIDFTPQTKNDVSAGFFQVASLLMLVTGPPPARLAIALSGAFLGVAVGTKYSSLHFAMALAPFATLFLARSAASRAEAVQRVALWAASLALCGSPFYLRNLVLFSNPVFPFANDVLGAHNGLRPEQSAMLREAVSGIPDFSILRGTFAGFWARAVKGFGVVPAVLMWPGAVLALGARTPTRVLVLGTTFVYVGLTVFAGLWEPRYFLSLLAMSSALAAVALTPLAAAVERKRTLAAIASATALLVAVVVPLRAAWPHWARQSQDVRTIWQRGEAAFVTERVPYYSVAQWLNTHMTSQDRVAIGFNVQPFYYLEGSYYHIHPLTEGSLVVAETPEEVLAALRGVEATLLAFSGSDGTYFESTAPRISAYRERLWLAQRRLRQAGRLRLVDTVDGVRILRLEDPPP